MRERIKKRIAYRTFLFAFLLSFTLFSALQSEGASPVSSIISVSPSLASTTDGLTSLVISGRNLPYPVSSVRIGPYTCVGISQTGSSMIVAKAPAGMTQGTYDITVKGANKSLTLASGFRVIKGDPAMLQAYQLQGAAGNITGLSSTTHSVNTKSSTSSITFNWTAVAGVAGYSYLLDTTSGTVPDVALETTNANANSVTLNASPDGSYYFHILSVGTDGSIGGASEIGPFPVDTTAPNDPSGVSGTGGDGVVSLSWTTPAASDYAGTMVRYNTGTTAPTSASLGTLLVDDNTTAKGTAVNFTHSGATNGTTYSYALFAYDNVGNYSAGVTTSATPQASSVTVASISPASGSNVSTTTVTIVGTGFNSSLTDVKIGTTPLTGIAVIGTTTITATVPSGLTVGTYDVTVTNPDASFGVKPAAFTVTNTIPTLREWGMIFLFFLLLFQLYRKQSRNRVNKWSAV